MLFEAAAATGHVESLEAQLVKDEKDAEEDGDEGDADSDYGDDDELDEVDAEEIVTIEDDGDDEEEEEELNFERSVPESGGIGQLHGNMASLSSLWVGFLASSSVLFGEALDLITIWGKWR